MSKQMIMNINFDTDSEEEQQPIQQQSYISTKIHQHTNFNHSAITKNIFHQIEEEDYEGALIVPSDSALNPITTEPKTEKQLTIGQPPSITLLHQINYDSEGEPETTKENHQEGITRDQPPQTNEFSLTSTMKSNILNIDFNSESSSDSSDEQSSHADLKEVLSLKFNQLQPVTLPEITFTHINEENMKAYTQKEVQLGKILNTKIYRDQSFFNSIWPEFTLYLQSTKMLVAKKMKGSSTSNYYITLQNGIDDVKHQYFIAKLRSNFSENTYNLYTRGVNPTKAQNHQKIRSIQATIVLLSQTKITEPRQFQVYTLALQHTYEELAGKQKGEEIGLDVLYKMEENKGKIFKFKNRKAVFSEAVKGYILNFGGRVQKASSKNFILEDVIASREVMMIGKLEEDIFRMDVSWPLKPYVAFCVCLANFDSKFKNA